MEYITDLMEGYVQKQDITGAAVRVFQNGSMVYDRNFGYTDIEGVVPVRSDTLYPLCSMTKPITAIAVMKLIEDKRLSLKTSVAEFIPEFKYMLVADQETEESRILIPAKREPEVFDLLNHSSGICTGPIEYGGFVAAGMDYVMSRIRQGMGLAERVKIYAAAPADFHPGEGTGYSAFAGFDILGYIVELVSGMDLNSFIRKNIMEPLEIRDLTFTPDEEQLSRMARVVGIENGKMADQTETSPVWNGMNPMVCGYHAGSGGMLGTLEGYGVIAQMLLGGGAYKGVRILEEETVNRMAGKGIRSSLRFEPEAHWGLGMAVFDRPEAGDRGLEPGTFGWSGACGTHFYIDPRNDMAVVLMTCGTHLMGGASHVSHALEKAVYKSYVNR